MRTSLEGPAMMLEVVAVLTILALDAVILWWLMRGY